MKRDRVRKMVSVLMAVCLLLCGVTMAGASAEDNGKIGVLLATLNSEIFVSIGNSTVTTLEEAGYQANLQSFEFDAGKAVTCIENFITDGVKGICYMNVDTSGDDALGAAMEAGIAVLTAGAANENYNVHLRVENYVTGHIIGEMAADYINRVFDGKAKVGCITSSRSQDNLDRVNGYKDALAENCPGAEIVYEAECLGTGDGAAFAENLNTLYPDCMVVLSYSDAFVVEASQVWNALDYPKEAALFGHDAESGVLADIAEGGYIKGTVAMEDAGASMATVLLGYLNGEYEDGAVITIPGHGVTSENIDQYYQK